MLDWLSGNYIELLGVLLSILYLFLSIKQNILLWPVGILSAILYIVVFYQSKFYADMSLNGYYFVISIYGWINWSKYQKNIEKKLSVTNLGRIKAIYLFLIFAIIFGIIAFILDRYTDSPLPYWDALTTSGSIIATWMLTKKILQHWIVWVFVDLISMSLYIYRGLYPTSVLFAIYTILAVIGYIQWKKSLNKEV